MLRFENYSKKFGCKTVLTIPELNLENGLYWLKGENGSGKTTLLKSIAGLIPFEGTIQLNAVSLKQQPIQYRRLVNFAEAEPLYPGFLTGNDLIGFYAETKQAPKEQVTQLIDAFDIGGFIGEKIGAYSSGMVKKLSLVLAFVGKPQLVLLDEPFITLDQKALQVLPQIISEYKQNGTSFLISSHQPFTLLTPSVLTVANQTVLPATALC
ncbi:ABC transporter ATP-binding protein [Pontibacter sp. H259]|uniref:ABC transporter ATP-binding protein n=1 Tax=Pontibacter sp. H259 TaxID=3133421 RepID=UPI0030BE261A